MFDFWQWWYWPLDPTTMRRLRPFLPCTMACGRVMSSDQVGFPLNSYLDVLPFRPLYILKDSAHLQLSQHAVYPSIRNRRKFQQEKRWDASRFRIFHRWLACSWTHATRLYSIYVGGKKINSIKRTVHPSSENINKGTQGTHSQNQANHALTRGAIPDQEHLLPPRQSWWKLIKRNLDFDQETSCGNIAQKRIYIYIGAWWFD